ncbi:hypothetical protein FJZ53_03600 [Candidatus Woesearchaeota archaeon]|nr:hypothetical protein [Candidatus Woesearchaeota archaeon]
MNLKTFIFMVLSMLLLACSVDAIKVYDTQCYDDGSFKITLRANNEKDAYTSSMTLTADEKNIKGEWIGDRLTLTSSTEKEAVFEGSENQLVEAKSYAMKLLYKEGSESAEAELSFELQCPGLLFTCKRLGVKINDCLTSKSGLFEANLDIYGLEQSEKANLDPIKALEYIVDTMMLYKDINGYTSKRGSLPVGSTITKTGDGKYKISAQFDKYTTNRVTSLLARFNDNQLPTICSPVKYPGVILSHRQDCKYEQTQADIEAEKKARQQEKETASESVWTFATVNLDKLPPEKLRESLETEIKSLEDKKYKLDTKLNELYSKRNTLDQKEKEEAEKTGYTPLSKSDSAKKSQLNTLLMVLLGVVVLGGGLLGLLYKEGYFY